MGTTNIQLPATERLQASEVIPGLWTVQNAYAASKDFFAPSGVFDQPAAAPPAPAQEPSQK